MISLVVFLGVLSLLQRVIPWLLYKRFMPGRASQKLFDLIAVSAFSSLMVYNMSTLSYQTVIPLLPAFLVVYRTKNLGLSILTAMLFAFILTIV